MSYRNIRIAIASVSALATLLAVLTLGFILLADPGATQLLPLLAVVAALVVFFATSALVGILLHPLSDLLNKVQRLSQGDYTVRFAEEGIQKRFTPQVITHLAESLDKVGGRVRSSMADVAAESRRQGQFISDVSHEIRTPLTAIRGAAETMLDEDIPYEDRAYFCENIIRESERLTRLAADLITLQRIEGDGEVVLKRVNLHDVVGKAIDLMEPLFEERIVHVSTSGEAPDVLGDPDRLQQVVVNLMDNASRHVEDDGHVHIELSGIRGHSVITVSDDGPGFGDIDPARLFDRFYRGDRSRARTTGGTGLGLTIVKTIVTSLDGTVEAVNLPGGGACFIVAIPSLSPRE
ncbi:MAG: HAMP domain-containing histidine kinase [Coriobacteriales bacterium]|jgi:two-component system OmpR family sensor kinase|nr:HAMP domain-containing histidine kinase [Coriobacteriales bacterium]